MDRATSLQPKEPGAARRPSAAALPEALDYRTNQRLARQLPALGRALRPLAHDLWRFLSHRLLHDRLAEGCAIASSNFCLPPVEYSPGTIPIQAARFRPFRKALALPTAAIRAVAVTGPTPGISVSRWQSSFSFAVFWMTRSISAMRAVS